MAEHKELDLQTDRPPFAPRNSGAAASNEAGIPLSPQAYRYRVKLVDKRGKPIELEDCRDVIRDIRAAFRMIAEQQMPKELKGWFGIYRANLELQELIRREEYGQAARTRDKIRAMEDYPDMGPQIRERINAHHAAIFESMPGIGAHTVKICRFLNSPLPTYIVTEDGITRINENFVKALHYIAKRGGKGMTGNIYDYPHRDGKKALGDLYNSLIYSVAINAVRGYFRVDEWGVARFTPDAELAQGERGGQRLLANLLAQYFYWIMFVELHMYPESRVEELIRANPAPFRKLTRSQREWLPVHLRKTCVHLIRNGGMPLAGGYKYVPTKITEKDVQELLDSYPDAAHDEDWAR